MAELKGLNLRALSIQISVTDFAVPTPRTGSLDFDGTGSLPQVGSEIHRLIQSERLKQGTHYAVEKWVSHVFQSRRLKITVSGRMDGFQFGSPPTVEEIKSSYAPDTLIPKLGPNHPYVLQLRTYGYIHWLHSGMEPNLKLVVVNSRNLTQTEIDIALELKDYEDWLKRRLDDIETEQELFEKIKTKRKKNARDLAFPFHDPRPGQVSLIERIQRHFEEAGAHGQALLQAPTGLGKTIGVLFPTLQESLGRGQKTIYVTAKNSQHAVAEDVVRRVQKTGTSVKSLTLHAKSKMCLKDEVLCNPSHCEFARDYHDKVRMHDVLSRLARKKNLGDAEFKETGRQFEVCPFELQLECVPQADVVICDYNYIFSPRHISGRISHNGYDSGSPPNLVVDEAHNLAARANEYYSAKLSLAELRTTMEEATYAPEAVWDKLKSAVRLYADRMRELADGQSEARRIEPNQLRMEDLFALGHEIMRDYLTSNQPLRAQDPVLKFCRMIQDFNDAAEQAGEEFIFTRSQDTGGPILKVTCLDSSKRLAERYKEFNQVLAFSATVKPFLFHLRTLGFDPERALTAEFQSPFPKENRKILIIPQISTKLRDRDRNLLKVRSTIEKVVELKPGNYFVFFPSFDFLNKVAALVSVPGFRVLVQEREMRRARIEEYLEALKDPDTPTLIFAVQGGVFAEGVDYPGRMLIGAMIVGPALPVFDFERELLRDYFDKNGGSGFDYAYTYPAMTRVIQSAGRVIRSAEDRGLIVLMDQRFLAENYVKAMPSDWVENGTGPLVSKSILQDIRDFWSSHESP